MIVRKELEPGDRVACYGATQDGGFWADGAKATIQQVNLDRGRILVDFGGEVGTRILHRNQVRRLIKRSPRVFTLFLCPGQDMVVGGDRRDAKCSRCKEAILVREIRSQ